MNNSLIMLVFVYHHISRIDKIRRWLILCSHGVFRRRVSLFADARGQRCTRSSSNHPFVALFVKMKNVVKDANIEKETKRKPADMCEKSITHRSVKNQSRAGKNLFHPGSFTTTQRSRERGHHNLIKGGKPGRKPPALGDVRWHH